ncbi:HK97 gp10 family phage protein [Sphingomonas beigongshangi]|uniref:HK97 gp10 family phage protein n=1 Tax=Sphingomonas beigongshangi TaxID=2782540 RepID=UPI001AED3736|nr:HK97 gp10 family phage protein [Sphingomonas beigongshangi]
MATRRGGAAVRRYMAELPDLLNKRVLPGAARAGAKVIAEEAKQLLGDRRADTGRGGSVLIADAVKVKTRRKGDLIIARVLLKGLGAYVGNWLEYGTQPHFITVDPAHRQGKTARRINKLIRDGNSTVQGTLVINGQPIGSSVHHPGARPHPFLRPARDLKDAEAKAAARTYVTSRLGRRGIIGTDEGDEE